METNACEADACEADARESNSGEAGRWAEAVAAATDGMSDQGARERRRHARNFASWCADRGTDPCHASRDDLAGFLASLSWGDWQLVRKAHCAIRAVLRCVDPALAARTAKLGNQTAQLRRYAGTPLGCLVDHFVASAGERGAVVKSALTRLFAWCAEVGIEPTDLYLADLAQYREWLGEVQALPGETLVVAKAFIRLRRSALGRRALGEPEPVARPLRLELAAPLRPRFELSCVLARQGSETTMPAGTINVQVPSRG